MTRQLRDPLTVRRLPEKQVIDRSVLDAVLDESLVAHVAVPRASRHGTAVVPVGVARSRDELLIHGSTASQAFRTLATGVPTCVTVTLLDGVVVARSQFESSMQYRSAMVFGSFSVLCGRDKSAALAVLAAKLLPGLTGAREPAPKELAATLVLSLPLDEWSLKVSDGDPEDADSDLDREVWAGVVPLHRSWGDPVTAPDLRHDLEPPAALKDWTPRG